MSSRNLIRFLLLNVIYVGYIALYPSVFRIVGYMYTFDVEFSWIRLIFGLMPILLYFCLSISLSIHYILFLDIIFISNILPALVVFTYVNFGVLQAVCLMVPMIMACLLGYIARERVPKANISFKYPITGAFVIIFMILFIFFGYVFGVVNLNLRLFEVLQNVYGVREKSIPLFLSYLLGWVPIIILPALLLRKTINSKTRLMFLVIFIMLFEVILFTSFAIKIHFLYFLYMLLVLIIYNYNRNLIFIVPYIIPCIVLLCTFIFQYLSPFTDRFFYLIGVNTFYYLDYFSSNELRFFEGGFLGFGIEVYGIPPGYIIDNEYYQGLGVNQSAGAIPTIYSDLGLLGLFVLGVILHQIYFLLSRLKKLDDGYFAALIILCGLMTANHQINMIFISNGVLIVLFFAVLAPKANT